MARLATVRPDGSPRLVPICFVLAGDRLYTVVDDKPKRTRALARLADIERDPRVEVLIDGYDEDWSRLWWVRLRGRARVVAAGPEAERAVALLQAKYRQYRERPPHGPVIVVAVEERRAWTAGGASSSRPGISQVPGSGDSSGRKAPRG